MLTAGQDSTQPQAIPRTFRSRPVVLVVDDDQIIADGIALILERSGMTSIAAYDGDSALEIARVAPPDLLLTDVFMPKKNGVELAIAVRSLIADCKVLLFSGNPASHDLLSMACDAGHYFTTLQKPIHPVDLIAHVTEALNPSRSGAASARQIQAYLPDKRMAS
jgi:CheY-like chemotaxis protein